MNDSNHDPKLERFLGSGSLEKLLEKADERTLKEVYNEMVSTNKRKTGLRGLQAWLGS